MSGGEVSNDHYPMYEFVFQSNRGSMQLRRQRTFFYDVAGIEGAELPWLGIGMALLAVAIAVPVAIFFALVVAVQRNRSRSITP